MTTKSRNLGRTFSERLAALRREKDYTIDVFARKFRSKQTTVREWLNKNGLPRAETIAAIASHFRVTTDWLLGMPDAPKHPDQWRTDAALTDDLAVAIRRTLADQFSRSGREWKVDGDHYLRLAIEAAKHDAESLVAHGAHWSELREQVRSLHSVAAELKHSRRPESAELRLEVHNVADAILEQLDSLPAPDRRGLAFVSPKGS